MKMKTQDEGSLCAIKVPHHQQKQQQQQQQHPNQQQQHQYQQQQHPDTHRHNLCRLWNQCVMERFLKANLFMICCVMAGLLLVFH